jgi:ATP synthase protein I
MPKKSGFKFSYALSIATQLWFMVAASIGGFLALGIWLDGKFGSAPLFLLVGMVVGIALTIYEVHHIIQPLITPDEDDHD